MKKILCPTDFSDAAVGSIAYAAKLAQTTNGELTLLHVQSMFDLAPVGIITGGQMTQAGVAERLDAQSREVSKMFRISCNAEVQSTFSKLSSVIRDKGKDYDLIVMGSNGPDDLYQFFSGSNAYNASAKSSAPMLIIPTGYVYAELKQIVYAFDYLKERTLPLAKLIPWMKTLKAELTVLQVMEEAYSEEAEDDLKELQIIMRQRYRDDLIYRYDTIRSSDIAQSINSYILKNQPDALALCSIHRGLVERIFHKSIIKYISAVCSYPVFIFHAEAPGTNYVLM
jgi:nucleotide-binding universal stress UspA family protein